MMNICIFMLRRSRIIDFIDCTRQALEREKIYLKISHQLFTIIIVFCLTAAQALISFLIAYNS